MPERIQLSRARGWRKPADAIVVARPSRWGNPFRVGWPHRLNGGRPIEDRTCAVELYTMHTDLMGSYELDVDEVRQVLGGHDLACWCPLPAPGEPDVCHAAVLLEIANSAPRP